MMGSIGVGSPAKTALKKGSFSLKVERIKVNSEDGIDVQSYQKWEDFSIMFLISAAFFL